MLDEHTTAGGGGETHTHTVTHSHSAPVCDACCHGDAVGQYKADGAEHPSEQQ